MEQKKILIIGGGRQGPTGRSLWLRDRLIGIGFDVEYQQLGAFKVAEKIHSILVDEHFGDFSELELRAYNALVYGTSHPEMLPSNPDDIHWPLPLKEPPPDKRKGPKGPRNRWGKL